MRRVIPAMILLALAAGFAVGQEEAEEETPTLQSLTQQATALQEDIRRAHNPDARKRLLERLELLHHRMGPTDAAGRPVHCQAMWHDRTLQRLDQEMKRLSGRDVPLADAYGPALVRAGRLTVRKMARACLRHGWGIAGGQVKYQVDAFGQYLANNLLTLDGLLKRLSGLSAPAAGAAAEAAEGKAAALDKARAGLAKMIEATDALADAPVGQPAGLTAPLGTFMEGLTAVREAVEGVQAAEPAEGEQTPPEEAAPAVSPPMTEAEKSRIAALREAAAGLEKSQADAAGSPWAGVAAYVERFAAMIEAGFTVVSARPKARELLEQTERAVGVARDLASSTLMDEALLAERREGLLQALAYMGKPAYRAVGYAGIARLQQLDALRRRVEGLDLPPETGRGIVQAYYRVGPKWENSTSAQLIRDGTAMTSACSSLVSTLERMRTWPPEDMAAPLQECYRRQGDLFVREAESAGARVGQDPQEALPLMQAAARRGADLALIVRAETVVRAIKRYRPQQAGPMYQRMIQAAQALVVDPENAAGPRDRLWGLIRPFEALERFPAPDPALQRTLTRLVGQAYGAAVAKLSRDIGAGINLAAAGNPTPLRMALRADVLFRLSHKRALAEEAKLQQVDVTNLSAFSMPAEVWASFHTGLDRRLQALFALYVRGGRDLDWYAELPALEAVYGPVVAAQHLTLQTRFPGEPDLDFLLRHLQGAAVPDPPEPARDAWAVGYHATEAAAAMIADFDVVADWHRRRVRLYRRPLDRVDLSAPLAAAGGT